MFLSVYFQITMETIQHPDICVITDGQFQWSNFNENCLVDKVMFGVLGGVFLVVFVCFL